MSYTFARLSRISLPCIPPRKYPRTFSLRAFSTTLTRLQIPIIPTCPSPTCACAPTPPDLDIDRTSSLLHTVAAYSSQVLLCTGTAAWSSNIEQTPGATGEFVAGLKSVIGKGAPGFDPFTNTLITASSLPPSPTPNTTTALLFPAFKRIPALPHTPQSYADFASAYLKPKTLHPMHAALSDTQKSALTHDPSAAARLPAPQDVTNPVILICGHAARDSRCGVLGPVLEAAFNAEFARRGIEADVAQISHIGGHKYAGNVIIYLPVAWGNELAGAGVWYGRVGPEHVEGVVGETVVKGRVVRELLRGGMLGDGRNLARGVEGQEKEERGEGEGALRLEPRARSG